MTSFKREIGMYQSYEMWSRLLCWDRKWVYVVTHFVKKGAVKPKEYILTDGSWFGGKGYKNVKGEGSAEIDEKAIFASAISKYVIKLGRLTTHPEVTLQASGVLPERPGGWASMNSSAEGSRQGSGEATPELVGEDVVEETDSGEWDWKRVERENKRGLKFAEHFGALDALHNEFSGSQTAALGRYRDFLV